VKRAEFESLLFVDVEERAAGGATSVAELPASSVTAFYRSPKSEGGAVMSTLRDLFSGS
jgi:hypothetical protein